MNFTSLKHIQKSLNEIKPRAIPELTLGMISLNGMVRSDRRSKLLDLIRIGWPKSHLTFSVSDLLSPVRSRSYGRKMEGGELTEKTSSVKSLRHWRSTVMEIWGSWTTAKYGTVFSSSRRRRWCARGSRELPASERRGGWS
jgi:hypothetical protein